MLWSAVLLVCCITAFAQDGRPGYTEYSTAQGVRGWLALRRQLSSWSVANALCKIEKATLAAPWSEAYTKAVAGLLTREGFSAAYSGVQSMVPALPGDDSIGELDQCGLFLSNGTTSLSDCNALLPYVCYAPRDEPQPRLRSGYEYRPAVRGWFKLHTVPRPYYAARLACHLEGAFLAAPWTPQILEEILAISAGVGRSIYLGVTDREEFVDAFFDQVNGFPMLSLNPESLTRIVRCLAMRPGGRQFTDACTGRMPFVCYAPLNSGTADPNNPFITNDNQSSNSTDSNNSNRNNESSDDTVTTESSSSNNTDVNLSETDDTPKTVPNTDRPIDDSDYDDLGSGADAEPDMNPVVLSANSGSPVNPPITNPPVTTSSTPDPVTMIPSTSTVTIVTTDISTSTTVTETSTASTTVSSTTSTEGSSVAPFSVCDEMGLEGYKWHEVTDQCYKFHPYGATWVAANATCQEEGTSLAVANSDEEAQLFKQLLLENLKTGIRDAGFKGAVALGFYYDKEKKIWITLDGTPLDQSGYAKWWPGWPFQGDEEFTPYGYMEHTGRLENYGPAYTTPFICEAPR